MNKTIFLIGLVALMNSVKSESEPTSVVEEWKMKGEAPTVTEAEVMKELTCLRNDDVYGPMIAALGEDYLLTLIYGNVKQSKKYYVHLNDSHRLMYFKEGENTFIHIYLVKDDQSEELMRRAFLGDKSIGCIRVLPESCVWKGQREVTYEKVCESGLDIAHTMRDDMFKVSLTEEHEGQISTPEVINAINDCYRPKCYSVAYECFQKGLHFDFNDAKEFLEKKKLELQKQYYNVTIDYMTMSLKYSKLRYEVSGTNDEPAAAPESSPTP